jgi:hypothetical protein
MASDETSSFQADLIHCPNSASDHHLTFPAAVIGKFQITAIPHAGKSFFNWFDPCHIENPMRDHAFWYDHQMCL